MNENTSSTNEHGQAAAETPSTAAEPAVVAALDEQHPQPADRDAMSLLRHLNHLIHQLVHELRHDLGHAITLIALHVVAIGVIEKTPLLALLTLH
jgi:hypothetical protein